MYIVRRAFRGPNGPMDAGSLIEPADIRDFKYRLQQKHIVEVNEQNFDQYNAFFMERFNVQIPTLEDQVPKITPVVVKSAPTKVVVKSSK